MDTATLGYQPPSTTTLPPRLPGSAWRIAADSCCSDDDSDYSTDSALKTPSIYAPTVASLAVDDDYCQDEVTTYGQLQVTMRIANSISGGSLTSTDRDSTGLICWPASHLLCFFLASATGRSEVCALEGTKARAVIELGSGIGKVGAIAALAGVADCIVCTDFNDTVLPVCQHNLECTERQLGRAAPLMLARSLSWGDSSRADDIIAEVMPHSAVGFDSVLGADIVYPSTTDEVLAMLFQSVRQLLVPTGHFFLTFVQRDTVKTCVRLLDAAIEARFSMHTISTDSFLPSGAELPPMLGAVLLVLRPLGEDENVPELGGNDCKVFPGIRSRLAEILVAEQEPGEEWQAPGLAFFDD